MWRCELKFRSQSRDASRENSPLIKCLFCRFPSHKKNYDSRLESSSCVNLSNYQKLLITATVPDHKICRAQKPVHQPITLYTFKIES